MEFTPLKWLNQFLDARQLQQPDGRELFRYQTTETEYNELKRLVAGYRPDKHDNDRLALYWYACGVLYCSEWYRRDFEQGWTWDPIWRSLGSSFIVDAAMIRDMCVVGLERFWKRPIRYYDERRNFLGSVFSEGGLPFKRLSEKNSRFSIVLKNVLARYEQAELLNLPITDLVRKHVRVLPQVFSEDISVNLLADMASQLMLLSRNFDLQKVDDPADALDKELPDWRASFPLPLDNETGNALLNNWLKSASRQTKKKGPKEGFVLVQSIKLDTFTFKATLNLPKVFSFKSTAALHSSRLELQVFEGDMPIEHLGAAFAIQRDGLVSFNLRTRAIRFVRKHVDQPITLRIYNGGEEVYQHHVSQSQLDIGETPVVFRHDDSRYLVEGQGSLKSKFGELLVLCGKQFQTELEPCTLQGVVVPGQYALYKVTSEQMFVSDSDRYTITPNSQDAIRAEYLISGDELQWPTKPVLTFIGLPNCTPYKDGQAFSSSLLASIGATPAAQMPSIETLGVQWLSYKDSAHNTLVRRRVGVLPNDFAIEFEPSGNSNRATVLFKTSAPIIYKLKTEGVQFQSSKEQGLTRVDISTEGAPPATLQFELLVNLLADPIEIELPFPIAGASAYRADGTPLPRELVLDDLLGAQLHLSSGIMREANFDLDLNVHARGLKSFSPYYWRKSVREKPLTISLHSFRDRIEELFALSNELDCRVSLSVNGPGVDIKITIFRYAAVLKLDTERSMLSLEQPSHVEPEQVRPALMLINAPEQAAIPITPRMSQGCQLGDYELPNHTIERDGPWLVVPDKRSEAHFRSMILPRGAEAPVLNTEVSSLQKAVSLFHPKENSGVVNEMITQMCEDLDHSGWDFLKDLYSNYSYLPLSTFEVWKALVNQPKALCIFLLKQEMRKELFDQFDSEFAIFWEFISPQVWLGTMGKFKQWMTTKGLPEAIVDQVSNKSVDSLCDYVAAYDEMFRGFLKTGNKPEVYPRAAMTYVIQEDYYRNDLLRFHADDKWPESFSYELKQWYGGQNNFPVVLSPFHDHHWPVMIFPFFAASVATGLTDLPSHMQNNTECKFLLKALRDFDQPWFTHVYELALSYFLSLED